MIITSGTFFLRYTILFPLSRYNVVEMLIIDKLLTFAGTNEQSRHHIVHIIMSSSVYLLPYLYHFINLVINRPGVAGAVLQSPPSLIKSVTLFLQIFDISYITNR